MPRGFKLWVPSCARFAPVAEQWFRLLVTDAEAPRHGLDLFGRDSLVLGKCTSQPDSFQRTSSILTLHPNTKRDAAPGPRRFGHEPLVLGTWQQTEGTLPVVSLFMFRSSRKPLATYSVVRVHGLDLIGRGTAPGE